MSEEDIFEELKWALVNHGRPSAFSSNQGRSGRGHLACHGLDAACWGAIRQWMAANQSNPFTQRKIALLLLLNDSATPLQVGEVSVRVGQEARLVSDDASSTEQEDASGGGGGGGGGTFDRSTKTLSPGGALVLVGWSPPPRPFKKQHVIATLDTVAGVVVASDMPGKGGIGGGGADTGSGAGGGTAGRGRLRARLLEKSGGPDKEWAKYVVAVQDAAR